MIINHVDTSPSRVILSNNIFNQITTLIENIQFPFNETKIINISLSKNVFLDKFIKSLTDKELDYKASLIEGGNVMLVYNTLSNQYAHVYFDCNKRTEYYSFNFNIASNDLSFLNEIITLIDVIADSHKLGYNTFNIRWYFNTRNGVDYSPFEEPIQSNINELAYPYFLNGVTDYVDRFLKSTESVLILIGSPGVGKTTLIRYIIGRHDALKKGLTNVKREENPFIPKSNKKDSTVFYTSDTSVLESDDMFINFATSDSSLMVLEDIDLHLTSRSDGNVFMYKLLSASDGLIKNMNRKIIISTNLPNVNDIDDALIRKGRCFGVMEFRKLSLTESLDFLKTVDMNRYTLLVNTSLKKDISDMTFSLAELYSDEFFSELEAL